MRSALTRTLVLLIVVVGIMSRQPSVQAQGQRRTTTYVNQRVQQFGNRARQVIRRTERYVPSQAPSVIYNLVRHGANAASGDLLADTILGLKYNSRNGYRCVKYLPNYTCAQVAR